MKKIIFGIFAHPDDESFGPSGTLLREVADGNDVHLISLTCGQAGSNPDNYEDLGTVREKEWRAAGNLIGARSMHHLGYVDGQLNNLDMITIAETIEHLVRGTVPDDFDGMIELMSMDVNGITGHIDHIVAARSACLAFYRLKKSDSRITRLRLACVPREQLPTHGVEWLYTEAGRTQEEIGEIVDNRENREKIIEIMRCHQTQRADLEYHLKNQDQSIGLDHFLILE